MITVNAVMLIMFIAAWIIANVILDVIRAKLKKRNMQQLIDTAYIQISKLLVSTLADLKERR